MDAIRSAETAHHSAAAMLDKAVQPVLKVHDLADTLAYADGEEQIRRRLEIIDLCRGLLDAVVIDCEDDFYFALSEIPPGVNEAIEAAEGWLSTVTQIPERYLWGGGIHKKKSGWSRRKYDPEQAESWKDLLERIQVDMIESNLHRLLSLIFQAKVNCGELAVVPPIDIQFSVGHGVNYDYAKKTHKKMKQEYSEDDKLPRAQKQLAQAKTAAIYASMGAVSRKEIRRGLKRL